MAFRISEYRNKVILAEGDIGLVSGESAGEKGGAGGWEGNIRAAVEAFLRAGVRIVVAPWGMGEGRKEAGESEIAAVEVCRAAVSAGGVKGWVFGAIGPPAGLVMLSEIDGADYEIACGERAKRWADLGVDGLWVGGFAELEAMRIAARASVKASGLEVAGGMIFDSGVERNETVLGASIPQACAALLEEGAKMIVVDSGESPDTAGALVGLAREAGGEALSVWARVSAGLPEYQEGAVVYPESPEGFASRAAGLEQAGAVIIGGGRGVLPAHFAAMAGAKKAGRGKSR